MATAFLVPMPRAVFYDANGNPLVGGKVYTYVPGGTVPKTTYQDAGETTPNSNPITLDGDGSCLLYGSGSYQITVTDALGNAIPAYSGLTGSLASAAGISAAMQPVVAASTTADALALLDGLPISLAGASAISSIASLRATTTTTLPLSLCYVEGYTTGADGGEGTFLYVASDTTSADNGGTIIVDASGRRWYRMISGSGLCVAWFGGSPSASDNAAALNAALAVLSGTGGKIIFGSGTWTFLSAITFAYPAASPFAVTIEGAGADATILTWATTNGLIFNLSEQGHHIHIRDLTLQTGSAGTSIGVSVTQTTSLGEYFPSDFTRVNWRGAIGSANYWGTCAEITGLSMYNVVGCGLTGHSASSSTAVGTGFLCQGAAPPEVISVEINFWGCNFTWLDESIIYGDYLQGMSLQQCNFTATNYGVIQPVGAGATIVGAQLAINNSQFNCYQFGVSISGAFGDITINGNLFYADFANAACIDFAAASVVVRVAIVGNNFEGNNSAGSDALALAGSMQNLTFGANTVYGDIDAITALAGSTVVRMLVTGNSIQGIGTANLALSLEGTAANAVVTGNSFDSLGTAVFLGATTTSCNVQANVYVSCINTVVNNGGGTNLIGVATQ